MQIREILQRNQPEIYRQIQRLEKENGQRQVKTTRADVIECMRHGAWRRGSRGAVRQIRWE